MSKCAPPPPTTTLRRFMQICSVQRVRSARAECTLCSMPSAWCAVREVLGTECAV